MEAFRKKFQGTILLDAPVEKISRRKSGITVHSTQGSQDFDYVVVATHADQALRMLELPSCEEKRDLGAFSYSKNETTLHSDPSAMPSIGRIWSSWNYRRLGDQSDSQVTVTYHMNSLQQLETNQNYFVTLNGRSQLNPKKILANFQYSHPQFTLESLQAQRRIPVWNGAQRTFFCGSYFGHGFHEDAFRSAVQACNKMRRQEHELQNT